MKRLWFILVWLAAAGTGAQQAEVVQSGTPALLEAINGKQAHVFLQSLEGDTLTFQAYKATRNMSVGISKVKSLTFFPKYDAQAVDQKFTAGDYAGVIATLAPVMEPYWSYMVVENNMRDAFCLLMDAYRKNGDFGKVAEMVDVLMTAEDAVMVQRGQVAAALVAIAEGDLETARKIQGEVTSEAAGLYLQASIERAENQPKKAIRTVSGIIIKHANEIEWLGPSELLCAYLYMDLMGPDSVITTNSPLHTARQVKNIYRGSSVAADATKLWASLGGEAIEAARQAEKKEMERIEAEKRAQREADRKAAKEAKDQAAREAKNKAPEPAVQGGTDGTSTNLTKTTEELESE